MPTYDIFHVKALHWFIPLYFFFGGLAAGSFLFSFWAGYINEKLKPLAKTAAITAPISLAIGLGFLVLDLGQPFRFWRIMMTFQVTSVASWGTWILNLFFAVSVLYAFLWFNDKSENAKKLGYVGLPLAVFAGMYTGVLLTQLSGNALWDSALLPWIFLLGGLLSAMAVAVLIAAITGRKADVPFYGLKNALCLLVVLELLMVVTELVVLYNGDAEAVSVANLLLAGEFAGWFVGLQIVVGLTLPLILIASAKRTPPVGLHAAVSILLLAGILAVRFIVVMAGQVEL